MFGIGLPELGVILVLGLLVFGPEKLPSMAREAARLVKTVRQLADNAKTELTRELGDDFKDLDLRDLDPRAAVRDAMWADPTPPPVPSARILRPNEVPPFDREAT